MKSDCEAREPELLLLGLGELPARQSLPVRAHLLTCPQCRKRYRALKATTILVAGVLSPAPAYATARHSAPIRRIQLVLAAIAIVGAVWATATQIAHLKSMTTGSKMHGVRPGHDNDGRTQPTGIDAQ